MDARVNYVILPLAKRLLTGREASDVSVEGYLTCTILHEIAHGLGPAYARIGDRNEDMRAAIGPMYSGLEEAKADVVGMFGLKWLVEHGVLPRDRVKEYYGSYVGGIFRTLRYGTGEAHGQAEMMEFNYLSEHHVILRDAVSGAYSVDYSRMPIALAALAKVLLEMEATGDRARAEAWFKQYDRMPIELASALKACIDIPVDIDPVFSLSEKVE
jgi:hypothetical protein